MSFRTLPGLLAAPTRADHQPVRVRSKLYREAR